MPETVVEKVVTETVTTPEGDASAAIEAAAVRVEEAQEIAEDIARAAMETQLGQQIATLAESNGKWQLALGELTADLSNLKTSITEIQTTQATQATELAALKAPQAAVLLTPASSAEGAPVEAQAAVIVPNPSDVAGVVQEEAQTQKRKRWI